MSALWASPSGTRLFCLHVADAKKRRIPVKHVAFNPGANLARDNDQRFMTNE
jgi:hypothetical protein